MNASGDLREKILRSPYILSQLRRGPEERRLACDLDKEKK